MTPLEQFMPGQKETNKRGFKRALKKATSLVVFISILGMVTAGFDFTLEKSLSQDNNMVLAFKLLDNDSDKLVAENNSNDGEKVLGESTDIKLLSLNKCKEEIAVMAKSTNSLYDYMNKIGLDPSFNSRSRLATKLKISNYQGTATQNKQILDLLIFENSCGSEKLNI